MAKILHKLIYKNRKEIFKLGSWFKQVSLQLKLNSKIYFRKQNYNNFLKFFYTYGQMSKHLKDASQKINKIH